MEKSKSFKEMWLAQVNEPKQMKDIVKFNQENRLFELDIKPMSVNSCWKGKRFKTQEYLSYEKLVISKLPRIISLPEPPYRIFYEFGFSNNLSDYDNPIKPFQDILQKYYKFNDKLIYSATIEKLIVPKGKEYIKFYIQTY